MTRHEDTNFTESDLAHLGETFNKMTQESRTQRDDLLPAGGFERGIAEVGRGLEVGGAV